MKQNCSKRWNYEVPSLKCWKTKHSKVAQNVKIMKSLYPWLSIVTNHVKITSKTTKNKAQCSNFKTYQLFKLWSHPNKCDRSKLNWKLCLLPLKKKNNHNANANTLKSSCIKVIHSSILLLLKYPWGTPHNFNYDLWRLLKTHDHTWY